jgi:hypothetical protein
VIYIFKYLQQIRTLYFFIFLCSINGQRWMTRLRAWLEAVARADQPQRGSEADLNTGRYILFPQSPCARFLRRPPLTLWSLLTRRHSTREHLNREQSHGRSSAVRPDHDLLHLFAYPPSSPTPQLALLRSMAPSSRLCLCGSC